MKFFSYKSAGGTKLGIVQNEMLYDLSMLDPRLPDNMESFLNEWENNLDLVRQATATIGTQSKKALLNLPIIDAPIPKPGSLRDGYAFRQHVASARRNRGADMIAEFDQYPVFYFGNPRTVFGPGPVYCMPDHLEKLDFELEVGIAISKKGRNIPAQNADNYIAGLMVMNDFSARKLQMDEMLLSLGPAKGKDFATTTGPWLVTPDELTAFEVPAKAGHTGKAWNLNMTAHINGKELSRGNLSDMDWTFAELIERASYGVDLYPGDIIGSGTVGTGCLLELNGTAKRLDASYTEQWLESGDRITLQIDQLGELSNTIVREPGTYSLLALKKGNSV